MVEAVGGMSTDVDSQLLCVLCRVEAVGEMSTEVDL